MEENKELLTPEQIKNIVDTTPLIQITSSNIKALGYNEELNVLRVMFKNGSSYIYENVEPHIWESLKMSPSKGKTLNESVVRQKDKYRFTKIN